MRGAGRVRFLPAPTWLVLLGERGRSRTPPLSFPPLPCVEAPNWLTPPSTKYGQRPAEVRGSPVDEHAAARTSEVVVVRGHPERRCSLRFGAGRELARRIKLRPTDSIR